MAMGEPRCHEVRSIDLKELITAGMCIMTQNITWQPGSKVITDELVQGMLWLWVTNDQGSQKYLVQELLPTEKFVLDSCW